MNRLDFNQGVQASANFLIQMAEDLEQRLPERTKANEKAKARNALGWQGVAQEIRMDLAKANLLRGMANNIVNELKK
jgi:hypothetical protein